MTCLNLSSTFGVENINSKHWRDVFDCLMHFCIRLMVLGDD